MLPHPAQYLLRFDDLCPTISRARWEQFPPLLAEFGIKPILAVIPDNHDPELMASPPDPQFWDKMRAMEAAGATIAVHGYKHLCDNPGKSLLGLHRKSEFAGAPEEAQREWIHAGLRILRGEGLNPRLWVAPRHGFDKSTLHALRKEGVGFISDGFARVPCSRGGVIWIPQQLWEPAERSKGLWTICLHSNTLRVSAFEKLKEFLRGHAGEFRSFDRVSAEYASAGVLDLRERLYETYAHWRIRAKRRRRRSHARQGNS